MSTTTSTTSSSTSSSSSTTTTQPPGYISKRISNPSLVQVTGGDILLFYDYADESRDDGSTISNIYKALSSDNGSTFSSQEKITSYEDWGTSGYHPEAIEKSNGDLDLTYHEERNVLFADNTTPLWQTECSAIFSIGTDLHFDPATSRLYVYQIYTLSGNKKLCGIVVFDTENWEVIRVYNTTSSPAYNAIFANEHVWWHRSHGEGKYATVSTFDNNNHATLVINDNTEIIIEYVFKDSGVYHLTANVDIDWRTSIFENNAIIYGTWIDSDADKLYIVFGHGYIYAPCILIGYIDLTEVIDPVTNKYTFNEVVYSTSLLDAFQISGLDSILVIPESNYIVLCASMSSFSFSEGKTVIVDIGSGGIVKSYTFSDDPTFPKGGIRYPVYYDGHIYATFDYQSGYSQENFRGMVDININTDAITYHQPGWATLDDYGLRLKKPTGDGRIIVAATEYGVTIYDIAGDTWELFNNDTLPGFEPTANAPYPFSVEYDAINDLVISGSVPGYTGAYAGIRAFDENGAFNKGKLILGTLSGVWSWGTASNLTQGNSDFDISTAITSDDVLWAIWTRRDETEYSLKWDRDIANLDLTNFLIAGSSVNVEWAVDSNNKLNFSLSNGHLFDPNNTLSAYNPFLQKGRKITLRFGEKINDIEYWQTQGSFIVDTIKLSYKRGTYPIIKVSCGDKSIIWDDVKVVATDRYDNAYPEAIISEVLQKFVGMDIGDINIPNLDNRHEIFHQWIDEQFTAIITDLLDHFSYVPFIDVDDNFTVKQITVDGSVDHTYTGSEIIDFSPDDNFSSFTNKVTVKGEGLYFVEVLFPEELVGSLSGTGGWWEKTVKVERIYYSTDQQKNARNPRLVVNTSIKDFKILWEQSGGDEYISDTDSHEYWVEITIEFPGITEVLYTSIGAMIIIGALAIQCDYEGDCGAFMVAFSIISAAVAWILGQVATYDYEIYAQPVGEEKQTIYADADDTEFQQHLNGQIVNEEINDSYCYTVSSCQIVADQELDIVKAQRKRLSFNKITHLQDEKCDRIQVNHPYSGQVMDIFITNLKRSFIKPVRGSSNSGDFTDSITGWRI